jgi:hypothetical protein
MKPSEVPVVLSSQGTITVTAPRRRTVSDIGWRVLGGWSGLMLQVSLGLAAGEVLYTLDRFAFGPLSERMSEPLGALRFPNEFIGIGVSESYCGVTERSDRVDSVLLEVTRHARAKFSERLIHHVPLVYWARTFPLL